MKKLFLTAVLQASCDVSSAVFCAMPEVACTSTAECCGDKRGEAVCSDGVCRKVCRAFSAECQQDAICVPSDHDDKVWVCFGKK